MGLRRFKLQNTRLVCPQWGVSIPVRNMAHNELRETDNDFRCSVRFDSELFEFEDCTTKQRMCVAESVLVDCSTNFKLKWDSFAIVPQGKVQVNRKVGDGYSIRYFNLQDLAFEGAAYDPD